MQLISTAHFGNLPVREDNMVIFPAGLPGFETARRFVFVEFEVCAPLIFLQSLERPDLCFITLPARGIDRNYRLSVAPEDLRLIGLPESRQPEIGAEVLCVAIVAVGDPPTANLMAPIVVGLQSRLGVQAIQEESPYDYRHPLEIAESVAAPCS